MTLFDRTGRALVVAPHADDEVLGAGGTLIRLADAGWRTAVWFATMSGYASADLARSSTTSARLDEARSAMGVLGVQEHRVLFEGEDKHLRLDTVAQVELVRFIEEGIRAFRPDLLVVPGAGHYHQDHRAVASACVAAIRPGHGGNRPMVPLVWAYGHTCLAGGEQPPGRPSVFVDIGGVLTRKHRAMEAYPTQLCHWPHPRSLEWITHEAGFWGACAGCEFAEAFVSMRQVF